jgi:hypothetical protein
VTAQHHRFGPSHQYSAPLKDNHSAQSTNRHSGPFCEAGPHTVPQVIQLELLENSRKRAKISLPEDRYFKPHLFQIAKVS